MSSRTVIDYRGHQIIAGLLKGEPTARIFIGKAMATKQEFVGATVEEAAGEARKWIDQTRSAAINERRDRHVGTVEEYSRYFSSIKLAEHHRLMLVAHAAAPNRTMSAGELATAAGWTDYSTANLHYGWLGYEVAQSLELELPKRTDGTPIATCALADSADLNWKPIDGLFRWRMHKELAEALRQLNYV